MAELHLVMDIGQTGMRAQVRHPGNTSPLWEDEFPGVRTDLPIFPQFAEVTRIVIERSGLAPSHGCAHTRAPTVASPGTKEGHPIPTPPRPRSRRFAPAACPARRA